MVGTANRAPSGRLIVPLAFVLLSACIPGIIPDPYNRAARREQAQQRARAPVPTRTPVPTPTRTPARNKIPAPTRTTARDRATARDQSEAPIRTSARDRVQKPPRTKPRDQTRTPTRDRAEPPARLAALDQDETPARTTARDQDETPISTTARDRDDTPTRTAARDQTRTPTRTTARDQSETRTRTSARDQAETPTRTAARDQTRTPVRTTARDQAQTRDPTAVSRIDADIDALPAPPPAWEMRPVTPDARQVAASTYTVRDGDSLRLISVRTGAGSESIARANDLEKPYTVFAGQQLAIPAGRYHMVREGETGIAIARAYNVDWSRIIAVNDLDEPYVLRTGQRILIPDAAVETLEERAARFHLDIDDIVTGGQPALAAKGKPVQPTSSSARVLPSTATVAAPARLRSAFAWPVKGTVVHRFGPGASGEKNEGVKIAVALDTPILAAADGVVAYVGGDIPALGGLIIIRHGDGWTTVYGHASQLLVQRGQSVKKGQMIALSGDSGFADRPELHFEMIQGRTPVDPVAHLPPR